MKKTAYITIDPCHPLHELYLLLTLMRRICRKEHEPTDIAILFCQLSQDTRSEIERGDVNREGGDYIGDTSVNSAASMITTTIV